MPKNYELIGSDETGWVIIGVSSETFEGSPVFETYNQIKHFVGYWLTNFEMESIQNVYIKWNKLYYDEDDEFIGKSNEWNYNNLPIYLRDYMEKI